LATAKGQFIAKFFVEFIAEAVYCFVKVEIFALGFVAELVFADLVIDSDE
jgi:hypothetical protein